MKYKIYMYTNIKNNKIYIGQTATTLEKRAGANGRNYISCRNFYNAILEYGWKNFKSNIIENNILNKKLANEREIYWISKYESTNILKGYNIQPGGSLFVMNDSIKKKIGKTVKNSKKFMKNNFLAHAIKVVGIKISNSEITVFNSLENAAKMTNTHRPNISQCCKKKKRI